MSIVQHMKVMTAQSGWRFSLHLFCFAVAALTFAACSHGTGSCKANTVPASHAVLSDGSNQPRAVLWDEDFTLDKYKTVLFFVLQGGKCVRCCETIDGHTQWYNTIDTNIVVNGQTNRTGINVPFSESDYARFNRGWITVTNPY